MKYVGCVINQAGTILQPFATENGNIELKVVKVGADSPAVLGRVVTISEEVYQELRERGYFRMVMPK